MKKYLILTLITLASNSFAASGTVFGVTSYYCAGAYNATTGVHDFICNCGGTCSCDLEKNTCSDKASGKKGQVTPKDKVNKKFQR